MELFQTLLEEARTNIPYLKLEDRLIVISVLSDKSADLGDRPSSNPYSTRRARELAIRELIDRNGVPVEVLLPPYHTVTHYMPCANQDPAIPHICRKPGILSCSGCVLVGYCSKSCQRTHWKTHKRDCKHKMNSSSWDPQWVIEGRVPTSLFGHDFDEIRKSSERVQAELGRSILMWAKMPPIDLINLSQGVETRDLSIAFIDSGDLRSLVKTINSLPDNYTGKLEVLLNDPMPHITARNFLMLSIFAVLHHDPDLAAEFALHIWFSIVIPNSFVRLLHGIAKHSMYDQDLNGSTVDLTPTTTICTNFQPESGTVYTLVKFTELDRMRGLTAGNLLNDVMFNESRKDFRETYYATLKPQHRIPVEEWRAFGLVMPFGAANSHLALANPTLISPHGNLMVHAEANPLTGWNIDEVVKAGIAHGTHEQDIMGCLFFYLKVQLSEFCKRLGRFNIAITMYDENLVPLAEKLPPRFSFDRIYAGAALETDSGGFGPILKAWGTRLKPDTKDSAFVGHFQHWVKKTPGATAKDVDSIKNGIPELARKFVSKGLDKHYKIETTGDVLSLMNGLDLLHDTSSAFNKFLKRTRAEEEAKKAGLKMREINQIVPHRIGAKLGTSWDSLPIIKNDKAWYHAVVLRGLDYTERYVEWTR